MQSLLLVAEGIRANAESLMTWNGKASLEDRRGTEAEAVIDIEFAYDAISGRTRYNCEIKDPTTRIPRTFYSRMFRDGEDYTFGPNWPKQMPEKWQLRITPEKEGNQMEGLSIDFHPMYFVAAARHGREHMATYLTSMYERYEKSREEQPTVEQTRVIEVVRDDDTILLQSMYSDGVYTRYTFAPAAGFNLTRYEAGGSGELVETFDFEFANISGIYLPTEWVYVNRDASGLNFHRRVEFADHQVNESLGDELFSLASMGLRIGDTVRDDLRGVYYEFDAPGDLQEAARGWRSLTVAISAGLIALLLLALTFRRRSAA